MKAFINFHLLRLIDYEKWNRPTILLLELNGSMDQINQTIVNDLSLLVPR